MSDMFKEENGKEPTAAHGEITAISSLLTRAVLLPWITLQDGIRTLRAGDESTVMQEDEDPIPAHEVR